MSDLGFSAAERRGVERKGRVWGFMGWTMWEMRDGIFWVDGFALRVWGWVGVVVEFGMLGLRMVH